MKGLRRLWEGRVVMLSDLDSSPALLQMDAMHGV